MALTSSESDFNRLERSINSMFNEFFADMNIPRRTGESQNPSTRRFYPNVDVYENPEAFIVHCELPGCRREDVQVEVRGENVLQIQGETKFNQEQHRGNQVRYQERRFGRFDRRIPLPENVKHDEIKAKFEQGVLEIVAPKNQQTTRKVEIA
ncbi:small heat shock protein [Jimgerdemannia flammicorona]|uniref:Small heat shock protein n=1 Tax=Jimgerdemannia flammicorona TaxID=994334 RepID=A0A433DAD9_9FUNG|nr:small heat shock protein [Jimgerdemannia flammicorona]